MTDITRVVKVESYIDMHWVSGEEFQVAAIYPADDWSCPIMVRSEGIEPGVRNGLISQRMPGVACCEFPLNTAPDGEYELEERCPHYEGIMKYTFRQRPFNEEDEVTNTYCLCSG